MGAIYHLDPLWSDCHWLYGVGRLWTDHSCFTNILQLLLQGLLKEKDLITGEKSWQFGK